MTSYVFKRPAYYKYEYQNWTQPVLTSNSSSPEITITDPKLSGGAFDDSGIMNWGSNAVTNFSDIYKAMDSNTSSYWTVNKTSRAYTIFDIEFNSLVKLKSIFIDGTVVNGYAASLTGSQIFSIDDKGNATFIAFSNDDNTNTITFNNVVVKKIRVCVSPGGDGGTFPTRIKKISISAEKAYRSVKATKDDYDFRADKAYVLKRKRPTEYRKTVIDTATAGTYTFDVAKERTAKIILVGGGGSGGQVWSSHAAGSGGGSGACVYIKAKLTAGTYTITNGAGASPYSNSGGSSTLVKDGVTLITASGGAGGGGGGNPPGVGGTYSISDNLEVIKEIIVKEGNTGTQGTLYVVGQGGVSLYGGYGAGGRGNGGSGTAGYIFVELTTDETDYDYKIDNNACYVLRRK